MANFIRYSRLISGRSLTKGANKPSNPKSTGGGGGPVRGGAGGTALEDAVKAITLIPGAGEFAYDTVVETRDLGGGATVPENRHSAEDSADWTVALDDLEASLPNAATVLLVVGWFGDDLRCGQCTVRPKVETATKTTTPGTWKVHTLDRSTALVVSSFGGTSAYGGTPSDQSIARAIRDLKARGYAVVFYPFLFMDVAQGNVLPNPYGGTGQPAYPWRGRITCDPAPSRNLLRWSQDVANAIWTKGAAVTVTDNAGTAPGGTATADLVSSTATGQGALQSIPCLASTVYTVSGFFKAAPSNPATDLLFRDVGGVGGHHLQINPVAGTILSTAGVSASGVIATGNGWYRFWMTYTTEAGQTEIALQPRLNQTPAPSLGWYVWGLQVERGAALSDYTSTTLAQVDKTATATTQVNTFFGSAAASDLSVSVNGSTNAVTASYSGPAEWSFRRFILHYAKLCAAINAVDVGAVDGFLIGSELKGLTSIRGAASTFPAVSNLKTLAADVKAILGGGVKIGYAADWSEYANYAPGDGTGDLFFNLDPLWSDSNVDFIGVDTYVPLSDWRDGTSHLDAANSSSIYDTAYLKANIEGGEFFDWYYANSAARDVQTRTTISDGAYGKPWVWRAKDFRNWWLNQHYDRPSGVQSGSPTGWVAQSKPIWFTELGVPSIDKGTNQPNVFYDPKSSESALPYYSKGTRDDLVQRRGIEALLSYWGGANNPVSALYGDRMIGLIAVWTWDARPYPAWPALTDVWGDTALWPYGHWLNGKVGLAGLGA